MAYKKIARPRCQWTKGGKCQRRPDFIVYTNHDQVIGAFCKKHASRAVTEISEIERKEAAETEASSHAGEILRANKPTIQ